MARAPQREYAEAEQILFTLESFELTDDERLEVSGRWFGVRGRRFVRPTLTVLGEHRRSRWLADLDHKPWSAEDGESWTATFPVELDGRDVHELELAVAPDIAIMLPAPPALRENDDGARAAVAPQATRSGGTGSSDGLVRARPASTPAAASRHRELDALRKRLDEQRKHVAELRRELERADVTRAEVTSALTRRDAAVRKFEAVVRERDEAIHEREQAIAERDDAIRRRDHTIGTLDEALARRELALHEAEEARREREGALRERQSMMRALTRMRAERDEAVSRRNAALSRIEHVQAEANAQITQLRRQLEREHEAAARARVPSAHAEEPGTGGADPSPGPAPAQHEPRAAGVPDVTSHPAHARPETASPPVAGRASDRATYVWVRRAIAIVVLIAAITAIVLIIHSP